MAAGLAGPSRVASVSPIDTVHGTCMDRHQATSDGGADILEAASLGRPLHFITQGRGVLFVSVGGGVAAGADWLSDYVEIK